MLALLLQLLGKLFFRAQVHQIVHYHLLLAQTGCLVILLGGRGGSGAAKFERVEHGAGHLVIFVAIACVMMDHPMRINPLERVTPIGTQLPRLRVPGHILWQLDGNRVERRLAKISGRHERASYLVLGAVWTRARVALRFGLGREDQLSELHRLWMLPLHHAKADLLALGAWSGRRAAQEAPCLADSLVGRWRRQYRGGITSNSAGACWYCLERREYALAHLGYLTLDRLQLVHGVRVSSNQRLASVPLLSCIGHVLCLAGGSGPGLRLCWRDCHRLDGFDVG